MSWKKFEEKAVNFLNNNFFSENVDFILLGGSNSNEKDINVIIKNKLQFVIEAKLDKSQIAQFVLIPDTKNRNFKIGKIKGLRKKTKEIISYMNRNYENFKTPTTSGIVVNCEDKLKFDCIDDYLQENNIQFIITHTKSGKVKIIHRLNFKKYFKIECIYRKKKSGSSDYKYNEDLKSFLLKHFSNLKTVTIEKKKTKLQFISGVVFQNKNKRYFDINSNKAYLSPIENDKNSFYLKKLSTTNNPTIIFQIEYIESAKDDSGLLKSVLKNSI